ncbi:GNAT family N-acetyltransferase [Catenulispora sp. NL8]|uniref:GNAT family N-acetyltransferase n=1 Tax=Catenulispora pinistramenti TaxID=2705254 RepID=A0ABS5KIW2_9ACTN|nr:GNAT family N-acetyltransferase [Catenulispora pinistramenti]MBS2545860.1 GNAT family N-acetyltransferase [Catenulispora pinistramenti]
MAVIVEPGTVQLRPWRADDIERLGEAAVGISRDTLALRFGVPYPTIPDWYLARIAEGWARGTWNACVAESEGRIVGWAEYGLGNDRDSAELAALVCDRHQGGGLGTRLVKEVAAVAKAAAVPVLYAQIQVGNRAARGALHAALPSLRYTGVRDGQWHYAVWLSGI